jgi:hypothetical protein
MVLETDDHLRQQGLDDDEFEELGERLVGQRKELGQLLARGQSQRLLPAMLNFFKLCGVEAGLPGMSSAGQSRVPAGRGHRAGSPTSTAWRGGRCHRGQRCSRTREQVVARGIFETWRDLRGGPAQTHHHCSRYGMAPA